MVILGGIPHILHLIVCSCGDKGGRISLKYYIYEADVHSNADSCAVDGDSGQLLFTEFSCCTMYRHACLGFNRSSCLALHDFYQM